MKQFTRRIAAAAAIGSLALLAGCATTPAAAPEGSQTAAAELTPVRIVHAAIAYEPLYIAEELGYFEAAGLDVELARGGVPQDNIAQAVGGSADIIVSAWDNITTSTSQGIPIRVLAGNSYVSDEIDTSGIIVMADSGITSLADLKGKTLAFDSLGGGGSVEVFTALADAGVDYQDVTLTAIPYAGQAAALEQGHVDAIFPTEPFYSQITSQPDKVVISNPVRETRAGMPITLWAATESWLTENEAAALAFVDVMNQAIEYYEDPANLEHIKEIRAEVTQTDISTVSSALPPLRTPIDTKAGQGAIDQLVRFDMVDASFPVDDMLWTKAPRLEGGQ